MKNTFRIIAMILALAGVTSCKQNPPVESNTPWQDGEQTIAYTVDQDISEITLQSDAEWDGLIGKLLDYAEDGRAVSFYNTGRKVTLQGAAAKAKGTGQGKSDQTITTTSREKIKAWCREKEAEGKTVTIVYNKATGEWSGTAYVLGPRETAPDVDADYYYYEEDGHRVQCAIDTTTVFVEMNELADSVLLHQLMTMGDALRIYGNVIIIENLKVDYSVLQNMLENSGQLLLLSPSIENSIENSTEKRRIYPLSTVVVAIDSRNLGQFHQWVAEHNVTIVDSIPQIGEYKVSSGSSFGLNSVKLSVEMYETGIFYSALPELLEVKYIYDQKRR